MEKKLLSSVLPNLSSELPSEMYPTARSTHSSRGMFVKRPSTSNEILNLLDKDKPLMSWTKVKESKVHCSIGI